MFLSLNKKAPALLLRPGNRPVKIKVQGGARALEVEYDPRSMTTDEIKKLATELQALVSG